VWSAGVVVGQAGNAFLAVCPDASKSPFTQASLDEALGVALGLGPIIAGEGVLDARGLGKCARTVVTDGLG